MAGCRAPVAAALPFVPSLSDPALGALCALGSGFTWALTSLLVRALSGTLNSVAISAVRSTVGGLVLLLWIVSTEGAAPLLAIRPGVLAMLGLSIIVAVAIGDTVFFESIPRLGLARAMTISTSYPVVAALLAAAFLGEPITLPAAAGALLTLAGLALIVASRQDRPEIAASARVGVAAAVLASVAWAVSTIILRAPLGEVEPSTAQAVRLPVAGALLWLTPWSWSAGRGLSGGGSRAVAVAGALSVLTALSSVMFVAGLKHAGVTVATVLSSTAPLFALPLGVVFLGESAPRSAVLGTLVTVIGIVVLGL